jgi:hypothetical protein
MSLYLSVSLEVYFGSLLNLYKEFEKQLALFESAPTSPSTVSTARGKRRSAMLPGKLSTIEEKLQKVAAKEAPVIFENHLGTMRCDSFH